MFRVALRPLSRNERQGAASFSKRKKKKEVWRVGGDNKGTMKLRLNGRNIHVGSGHLSRSDRREKEGKVRRGGESEKGYQRVRVGPFRCTTRKSEKIVAVR